MSTVTLGDYQQAEREMTMREALIGLRVHALVTVAIWAATIPMNVFLAPEFPWAVFVVAGTGLGLFLHWFGYRHADTDIRRRQQQVEVRAAAHLPKAA